MLFKYKYGCRNRKFAYFVDELISLLLFALRNVTLNLIWWDSGKMYYLIVEEITDFDYALKLKQ